MKKDYAAIAASTIAALLLAVNPAVAGDAGKKAGAGISTDTSTSVTTETKPEGSTDSPSASPKMGDEKDTLNQEQKDSPSASPKAGDVKEEDLSKKDAEKPVK